jgi:Glycosyl hydrolase family 99
MRSSPSRRGITGRLAALALAAAVLSPAVSPARASASTPIPVLAYYYIWFTPTSWERAKRDLPMLGPYSSDQASVMRQHVRWAKRAGIDGFIVSWKSTPVLDRRLARLVSIADAEHFKLALIYEGLDFERRPLPAGRVAADLKRFAGRYGRDPAFRLFGREPVVIWSGTWMFTPAQVAGVTRQIRGRLRVLASEKNLAGYRRLAAHVDGDAYYWSSVDPLRYPGYPGKLNEMGRGVHAHGGLWIAPAAPGFDARLLGGSRVVPRRGGATLRRELAGALSSSPDAVGLISWNEFSESSQVEPSRADRGHYLHVLAGILGAPAPSFPDLDSDQPVGHGRAYGLPLLLGIGALCLATVVLLAHRRRRRGPMDPGARRARSRGA